MHVTTPDHDANSASAILRRVIDNVPALIGYWDSDLRNIVANEAYVDYFGLSPDQVRGMHIRDVLGPEVYEMNRVYIEGALEGARQQFDRTLIDTKGNIRYTQATYIPDVDGSVVRGFFVQVADISRRIEAERERDDAVRLFETSMHHAPIGQAVLDTSGRWLQVNQAMCDLVGYSATELRTMSFRDIVHPDDIAAADLNLAQLVNGPHNHIESEKRYVRKDGTFVYVQRNAVIVRSAGDHASDIIIAQIHDITRRRNAEAELARQAVSDSLTGLGNRHFLMAQLDGLEQSRGTETGLLFVDLDRFKTINDTHGHAVGDELLVEVAERIRHTINDVDEACRIGGDEFVVLARSATTAEDVARCRLELKNAVSGTYALSLLDKPVTITASVGSSWSGADDHRSLLAIADESMYQDKARARARESIARSTATRISDVDAGPD